MLRGLMPTDCVAILLFQFGEHAGKRPLEFHAQTPQFVALICIWASIILIAKRRMAETKETAFPTPADVRPCWKNYDAAASQKHL
jgi:hypothetical protein